MKAYKNLYFCAFPLIPASLFFLFSYFLPSFTET